MNPTQKQDNTPEPRRDSDGLAGWFAGLLGSRARFREHLATATGTTAQTVPGPTTSPVLGLPMTDADRRRYALREVGYTGWVDADGYARTGAEVDRWHAFMGAVQSGYLPGIGGGWVLTYAGREALRAAETAAQFKMAEAFAEGVSPDQFATSEWDGESLYEWLSDQEADEAEAYGERQAERWLDQAEAADAAESDVWTLTEQGHVALAGEQTATEPPETVARVLRSAALYLERHGWIQGAYYDGRSGSFTPSACLVGAIGMVCYGGPVDAPAQHFDDPGFLDFEEAVLHLDRYLLVENSSESYEFNDAWGRTRGQVTDVLRDASTRPVEELIDAIKAIDDLNNNMAALAERLCPSGMFAESDPDGNWHDGLHSTGGDAE